MTSLRRSNRAVLERQPLKNPPGPRGHFLAGTASSWHPEPLTYMQQLVRDHGPAVRFHYLLGMYGYLFTHPDHYQHILLENYKNYSKQHPIYAVLRNALGDGLVTLDPPRWRVHRKLLQPGFQRSAVAGWTDLIVRHTDRMLARWDDAGAACNPCRDISADMTEITLGVIIELLFGRSEGETADVSAAFTAFGEQLIALITHPWAWFTVEWRATSSARRLHAAAARLRASADRLIASRTTDNEGGSDLLGLLLGSHESSGDSSLSGEEVRNEMLTMLLAGHETSATALTWTFHLLATHPEVEGEVRDELESVLCGNAPSAATLPQLVFLRAVAQEAMRLYPPVYAFDRRAVQADVVGGYEVRRGAAVTLCPFITHRLPEFWPEPERFDPTRFTRQTGAQHKFAYLPFAAGPRRCIGEHLALTEVVLVLARVLQRYRLAARAKEPVMEPRVTLRPRDGLPMFTTRLA